MGFKESRFIAPQGQNLHVTLLMNNLRVWLDATGHQLQFLQGPGMNLLTINEMSANLKEAH